MNGNFDISRFKQSLIDALTESLKNQGADEAKRYATELETREAELAGVRPQVRESLMGRRGRPGVGRGKALWVRNASASVTPISSGWRL